MVNNGKTGRGIFNNSVGVNLVGRPLNPNRLFERMGALGPITLDFFVEYIYTWAGPPFTHSTSCRANGI